MSVRNTGLVAAALALGAACSDSAGPSDNVCKDETTSVEATVATGNSVSFNWAPACEVALVLIEADGSDKWLISTFDEQFRTVGDANKIKPPVTYGVAPSGIAGLQTMQPEQLIAGQRYELILWRRIPANSVASCAVHFDDYCMIALKSFTR